MERCPTCAALVPTGAMWCSLCFTDLSPAPVASPTRESVESSDQQAEAAPHSEADPAQDAADTPLVEVERRPGRHARVPDADPPRPADRRQAGDRRRGGDRRRQGDRRADNRNPEVRERDLLEQLDFDLSDETLFALLREDLEDRIGPWSRRMRDPKFKWGIAAGGAVGLIALLVVAAAVFGSFV